MDFVRQTSVILCPSMDIVNSGKIDDLGNYGSDMHMVVMAPRSNLTWPDQRADANLPNFGKGENPEQICTSN